VVRERYLRGTKLPQYRRLDELDKPVVGLAANLQPVNLQPATRQPEIERIAKHPSIC
jgi:hypothetical protein